LATWGLRKKTIKTNKGEKQMKIDKKYGVILMILSLVGMMFTGCNSNNTILPSDIIQKVVETNKSVTKSYCEFQVKYYEKDKLTSTVQCKEWQIIDSNTNKRKLEQDSKEQGKVTSVFDGKTLKLYSEKENQVIVMNIDAKDIAAQGGQKERLMNFMEGLKETHDIKQAGDATINGIKTYHVVAEPKKKDGLIGHIDYYIDKSNWGVVKNITTVGDIKTEMEIKKYDTKIVINEDTFKLDYPSSAKIDSTD
jgi:outer membrane lipoprotein-sorting protein